MDDHPCPELNTKLKFHPTTGMHLCLLGGFRIACGENFLTAEHIRLRKARNLLALLALSPGFWIHREQLLEILWPARSPQTAAHNLSQTAYTLRSNLARLESSVRLNFEGECLVLRADGGITTDVDVFEQLAHAALLAAPATDREMAAACINAILAYTGDLLPEDGPSDLFYRRRDQLRELYLDLLLKLSDCYLGMGEFRLAIDSLHKAIAADPAAEATHVRLMRAYALNGQRQAALRQYYALEEALRRELDVEPALESQRLRQHIIDGKLLPLPYARIITLQPPLLLAAPTGAVSRSNPRLFIKVAESPLDEHTQGVIWIELVRLSRSPIGEKMMQK